jgi:hypothetical protein
MWSQPPKNTQAASTIHRKAPAAARYTNGWRRSEIGPDDRESLSEDRDHLSMAPSCVAMKARGFALHHGGRALRTYDQRYRAARVAAAGGRAAIDRRTAETLTLSLQS